jgi:hypothetical protein
MSSSGRRLLLEVPAGHAIQNTRRGGSPPRRYGDQADEHRHLDQWADRGRDCGAMVDAEGHHRHGDGQL